METWRKEENMNATKEEIYMCGELLKERQRERVGEKAWGGGKRMEETRILNRRKGGREKQKNREGQEGGREREAKGETGETGRQ